MKASTILPILICLALAVVQLRAAESEQKLTELQIRLDKRADDAARIAVGRVKQIGKQERKRIATEAMKELQLFARKKAIKDRKLEHKIYKEQLKSFRLASKYQYDLEAQKEAYFFIDDLKDKELKKQLDSKWPKNFVMQEFEFFRIDRGSLARHTSEPVDASEILKEALEVAEKTDGLIVVQETASGCAPCHILYRFFEKHRTILEKDYLWIKIDRGWDNSKEVMEDIYPPKQIGVPWIAINDRGIPWFAIIDSKKNLLASSNGPDGNIGFPVDEDEIEHFLGMLESTMTRMTREDLEVLRKSLEQESDTFITSD